LLSVTESGDFCKPYSPASLNLWCFSESLRDDGAIEVIRGGQGDRSQEVPGAVERRGAPAARSVDLLGKHPAQLLTEARILLKGDVSEAGEGWSDRAISSAPDTGIGRLAIHHR